MNDSVQKQVHENNVACVKPFKLNEIILFVKKGAKEQNTFQNSILTFNLTLKITKKKRNNKKITTKTTTKKQTNKQQK